MLLYGVLSGKKRLKPKFFGNENVNGENYRNMLINYAFPRFETPRRDYIFQQNCAPTQSFNRVRNYLNHNRAVNWIGRGGLAELAPRSPELTVGAYKWERFIALR